MLTDDEKQKIRAEEAFRAELRKEFSTRSTSRLWTFVNSAFGLWLLSAVVLAGMTTAVTAYRDYRNSERRREEHIRRLDTEITCRFQNVDLLIVGDYVLGERPVPPDLARRVLGAPGPSTGCLADLSTRNLLSLLDELARLLPSDDADRAEIIDAFGRVQNMTIKYLDTPVTKANVLDLMRDARQVADIRWSWSTRVDREIDAMTKRLQQ